MDLNSVIEELYGLDPAGFTGRRDQLSAQARSEGDKHLAAAIKGLRRPSVAAWTVNLMARVAADEIDRLIELGGRLREAQAALSGDELRALGRQRSQLVAGLAQEARRAARHAGHPITEATEREVQATFEAALADEAAGAAVRAGRLARALERNGMDPVELEGAVAGPADSTGVAGRASPGAAAGVRTGAAPRPAAGVRAGAAPPAAADSDLAARARAKQKAAAEQAAEQAAAEARQADQRRAEARAGLDGARAAREEADDQVHHLEEQLASARRDLDGATDRERQARRALTAAEEDADRAASAARRARAEADTLAP